MSVEGNQLHYYDQAFPIREGTADLPLPELLDAQYYRLAWWRLARTELNYRRFFTISDLIGVRVDDPEVFRATHTKILELLRDGVADGLRIDHPDGLADPGTYLRRLSEATGSSWTVVEKILTGDEHLQAEWAVAGTTGYDALHQIDGLFTDPQGTGELAHQYREFTGLTGDRGGYWEATVRRAAYKVLTHELAAETEFLVRTAARVCAADPALRDHAPWALRIALRELLVRVPVYRPYVTPGSHPDRTSPALPPEALARAAAAFTVPEEAEALSVVRDLALGALGEGPDRAAFCARFAQTASALRAKSVEDTAFYRYAPLLSAAEVGGDPGSPAVSPEAFHAFCARIARDWPGTGTVLTTHDTKRSADVRARIAVLTECPSLWGELLTRLNATPAPDPQLAWTAWQTAFGFGLPDRGRLEPALLKSVREAGLHTSWTEQDPVYEEAVAAFVAAGPCGPPHAALAEFSQGLDPYVRANALGAALVHLTMPGVPDVYQGSEGTYIALVDPDNRDPFRPADPTDEKLALTTAALRLRRQLPDVFGESGTYTPLTATGPTADHCLAFSRSGEAITAVTRLSLRLAEAGGWGDTELPLPEGAWTDLLAPEREFTGLVRLTDLFALRPVALLTRAVRADSGVSA